ncbi:MAG: hypothetical protein ACKN9W_20040 [Methylococcus sp.]
MDIPSIHIVCNTEVSADDVKTVRMATGARHKELEDSLLRLAWNAGNFLHLVARSMDNRRNSDCRSCMTCCANLARTGGCSRFDWCPTVNSVQRISGHKTLSMVVRYTHANGDHIRAALDKLETRYRPRSETESEETRQPLAANNF